MKLGRSGVRSGKVKIARVDEFQAVPGVEFEAPGRVEARESPAALARGEPQGDLAAEAGGAGEPEAARRPEGVGMRGAMRLLPG